MTVVISSILHILECPNSILKHFCSIPKALATSFLLLSSILAHSLFLFPTGLLIVEIKQGYSG
jgi:hypothetical protein